MRWDVNVLNSSSFPFNPPGFTHPKGQLSILANLNYGWYSDIGCGATEYLLITDSLMDPLPQGAFCIAKDSVEIDNIINPGILANVGLTIFIERWKSKPMNVGIQKLNINDSSINIKDNKLFMTTKSKDGIFRLLDISGKIILEKNFIDRNFQIDVSFLPQSIFIAQIISIDKIENFKFINSKN